MFVRFVSCFTGILVVSLAQAFATWLLILSAMSTTAEPIRGMVRRHDVSGSSAVLCLRKMFSGDYETLWCWVRKLAKRK